MTLASVQESTVVGVTDQGYRTGISHHNYNGRVTPVMVDAFRELHEDMGISYGCLSLMYNISRGYIAQICRYEKRISYPVKWKTIKNNR